MKELILVPVYMTAKEKKKVEEAAAKEHRSVSQYLKLKGLGEI